ncbi:hypothetical protein HDU96_007911, partial [Phlyctochytrium bullatum]
MSYQRVESSVLDIGEPLDTPEAQLEFQNFVLSSAEANLSGQVKPRPPPVPQSSSSSELPDFLGPAPGPRPTGITAFWTMDFYAQFFNVDFDDVKGRIIEAVVPRGGFQEKIAGNPDLYGPFWISMTVVFALFMTSTVAGSISAYLAGADFTFNMTLLTMASTSVFAYVLVMPTVIWGLGKYFAVPVPFFDTLNAYGYGLSIWIPVSIFCVLPSELLRWIIILAAFGVSTYFLFQTLAPQFVSSPRGPAARTAAIGCIVVANAALALLFRFGFFRYINLSHETPKDKAANAPF